MKKKPICLLDVDGVLAPWPSKLGFDQDVFWHHEAANVHLRRDLPELINKLAAVTELHWGTAWEREANTHILPHMGLNSPLPFLEFSNYDDLNGAIELIEEVIEDLDNEPRIEKFHRWAGDGEAPQSWKLPWIERYCREHADRAIAWVDDEAEADSMAFAERRSAEVPTLFIKTEGLVGMDESHVEQIETWVDTEVYEWKQQQSPA